MSVRPDALELAEKKREIDTLRAIAEKNREIDTLRAKIKDLENKLSEYQEAWLKQQIEAVRNVEAYEVTALEEALLKSAPQRARTLKEESVTALREALREADPSRLDQITRQVETRKQQNKEREARESANYAHFAYKWDNQFLKGWRPKNHGAPSGTR